MNTMAWVILIFQLIFIGGQTLLIVWLLTNQHLKDREHIEKLIKFIKPDTFRKNVITEDIKKKQEELFKPEVTPTDAAVIKMLNSQG